MNANTAITNDNKNSHPAASEQHSLAENQFDVTHPYSRIHFTLDQLRQLVTEAGGEVRGFEHPMSRVLWGAAPTGSIHIGYLGYFGLLHAFRNLGFDPLVIVADYHAFLDSEKSGWGHLKERTDHYVAIMKAAGLEHIECTKETYARPEYLQGLIRIAHKFSVENTLNAGLSTIREHKRSCAEVLYVLMQIYDASFLCADAVMCGRDESDIYKLGVPMLSESLGESRSEWYLPMCPGLVRPEMHASDRPDNKILVTDDYLVVKSKLANHALSIQGGESPSLFDYMDRFIFPLYQMEPVSEEFRQKSSPADQERRMDEYAARITFMLKPFNFLNQ